MVASMNPSLCPYRQSQHDRSAQKMVAFWLLAAFLLAVWPNSRETGDWASLLRTYCSLSKINYYVFVEMRLAALGIQ
jgi:hypothetical protein